MSMWKLSAGTAYVTGKLQIKTEVLPTTAYVMLGEKCRNSCVFCAQARNSSARAHTLSRITWPEVAGNEAAAAIAAAFRAGRLKRACLQVVQTPASWQESVEALAALQNQSAIPICISSNIGSVEQAKELIQRGAERICIALDAATSEISRLVKGGQWEEQWNLLTQCARALPGKVSTHLIVGLGETEAEMIHTMARCMEQGITVGLFAFTPLRGTAWVNRLPPSIGQYRRMQIAHYLLKLGYDLTIFQYSLGELAGVNLASQELSEILRDGRAFETSGCPDCNRPYYNERPGKIPYNYPRALALAEVRQAIAASGLGMNKLPDE